ncbi:MAG: hypothetical protein EBZ48_01330, partial [Proteobacteria bacterium]|nr:hypothetical protein [Pseudomonadota bacterium]
AWHFGATSMLGIPRLDLPVVPSTIRMLQGHAAFTAEGRKNTSCAFRVMQMMFRFLRALEPLTLTG